MKRNMHTTTENNFDYMANTGQEEQDRDSLGMLFAIVIMAGLTVCQYLGLY